jgi:hypothetical protein
MQESTAWDFEVRVCEVMIAKAAGLSSLGPDTRRPAWSWFVTSHLQLYWLSVALVGGFCAV